VPRISGPVDQWKRPGSPARSHAPPLWLKSCRCQVVMTVIPPPFSAMRRLLRIPSAQLAAEKGSNSIRRRALVVAWLFLIVWAPITAKPRTAHHLIRERKYVFRQFRIEVSRLFGRRGEVPGVDEKVTRPQLDERGAGSLSYGQLVSAGKRFGLSKGLLRRLGRGPVGVGEAFGKLRHLSTGSLYDSLVACDDMVDESLHIPLRTRCGCRQLIGCHIDKHTGEGVLRPPMGAQRVHALGRYRRRGWSQVTLARRGLHGLADAYRAAWPRSTVAWW
jgi:hypothetical protein